MYKARRESTIYNRLKYYIYIWYVQEHNIYILRILYIHMIYVLIVETSTCMSLCERCAKNIYAAELIPFRWMRALACVTHMSNVVSTQSSPSCPRPRHHHRTSHTPQQGGYAEIEKSEEVENRGDPPTALIRANSKAAQSEVRWRL